MVAFEIRHNYLGNVEPVAGFPEPRIAIVAYTRVFGGASTFSLNYLDRWMQVNRLTNEKFSDTTDCSPSELCVT